MRAYRRPLTTEEAGRYQAVYDQYGANGFERGIRVVISTILQSPNFLYHVEFGESGTSGTEITPLGQYELAARLSFFLWNSVPDAELFRAASAAELSTPLALRQQAERMLADPRASGALENFHVQWLGIEDMSSVIKDAELFPEFNESMRNSMRRETVRFAEYVIQKDDGRLATLLTAPYSFPEPDLFPLYGVTPTGQDPNLPVALDPTQRSGLLTQLSLLTKHAHSNQTSPVHRGIAVRQNLMCQPLPDPPANVNNNPPEPDPNATTRERFAEHTADAACAGCHSLIDPLGFGFEQYDAIGRFQTSENGIAIDASGEVVGSKDIDGPFNGAIELGQKLAGSQQVQECMVSQWFRFAFGRFETGEDACVMTSLADKFAQRDFNVRELMLDLVVSDAFRYRRGQ